MKIKFSQRGSLLFWRVNRKYMIELTRGCYHQEAQNIRQSDIIRKGYVVLFSGSTPILKKGKTNMIKLTPIE